MQTTRPRMMVVAVATATVLMMVQGVVAQSRCIMVTKPTNLVGDSVAHTVISSDACDAICTASNCVAWDHYFAAPVNNCYVFSSVTYSTEAHYARYVTMRCLAQLPQENADYKGLDIGNTPAVTAHTCSFACDDNPKCLAYSWTAYNGGTCYMKSDKPSVVVGPYDGSVISGESNKCSPLVNYDIVGDDLSAVPRKLWPQCCGECRRTPGCRSFTWSDYNGGMCWLKSKALPTYRSDALGMVSAPLRKI